MTKRPARKDIRKAASLLESASYTVVLTGAGSSTPSGIPDFRSSGNGLWRRQDPMEVASLSAFRHNPQKFFEWLRPLAKAILEATPNPAHLSLARLEKKGYIHTTITQNIDGLHRRAGSQNVLSVHGTIQSLSCINCYQQFPSDDHIGPYVEDGTVPRCPDCECILKPDVVLFEEQLPAKTWLQAKKASHSCDLMIIAGSSLVVMPVAGLPMEALQHGASLIVINKTPTYIDAQAAVVLTGDMADIIPAIASEIFDEPNKA